MAVLLCALVGAGPVGLALAGADNGADEAGWSPAVEEPDDYRFQDFRAPVPETLLDADVLSTAEALALWEAGKVIFVDVYPKPPRPANLPEGTYWREPTRQTIDGAIWLPNVGYGRLAPEVASYFRDGMASVAASNPGKTVVILCQADCWMSWNAARRAILDLGMTEVAWFPDGTDGWTDAGLPLVSVAAWTP